MGLSGLRNVIFGLLRPLAEEELLHFFDEERAGLGLDGGQSILVDEHGLMRHPLRPAFLRDVVVDAFAEISRVRRVSTPSASRFNTTH